jgi:hypothetical protein
MQEWWAVLGSNQWPLPCETEVGCLRINDMRLATPVATSTWYHVMSFDITQCHECAVPKLSQRSLGSAGARVSRAEVACIPGSANRPANCPQ